MVIILDSTATREQIAAVRREIEQAGCGACPAQASRRCLSINLRMFFVQCHKSFGYSWRGV